MQKDNQLVDWYNELDKRVANGIKSYAGEKPTIKGVAKLGTIFINEVSVTHQSIGHGLSNYTPWLNKLPRQVSKDDALEPIGNSQAYANVALIATAPASVTFATDFTSPDQPFSKVLTTTQKELMKEFLANMAEYNKELKLKAPKEQQLDITFPEDTAPSIDA